jgi:hypothetical protein
MSLAHALERLRCAILPQSEARRGAGGERVTIATRDLMELLTDHQSLDAQARVAHFHANRPAYPPRVDMLARAASDPGMYAGARGERTMGRWIADAILAVEHQQAPLEIQRLNLRMHQIAVRYGKTRGEISYALEEGAAELLQQSARIERLRRILDRYGDRVPMATCHRADWQQEIDDALSWVADNPEEDADGHAA